MSRDIFRKVPLSEKKALFKKGSEEKMIFLGKGDSDDLFTLLLDGYVDGKVLTFNFSADSPKLLSNQNLILNFSYGEDRYFLQGYAEAYDGRVHVMADVDVYILQRRKSPRLDIPEGYPGSLNIIEYKEKFCLYECVLKDFSSGGSRVAYRAHLPLFKSGDKIKMVIHLSHRNPLELDGEIKHHVFDQAKGEQVFGIQFKLDTTILENKMLVIFMALQRELFVKWNEQE